MVLLFVLESYIGASSDVTILGQPTNQRHSPLVWAEQLCNEASGGYKFLPTDKRKKDKVKPVNKYSGLKPEGDPAQLSFLCYSTLLWTVLFFGLTVFFDTCTSLCEIERARHKK